MQEITHRIQEEARKLLQEKKVDLVIGYQQSWDEDTVTPCFITDVSGVDKLVFNERCTHNLAKYLVGREGYLTSRYRPQNERPRVALVARPATQRTVAALIQEHQFERRDLIILGIVDGAPVGVEPDIEVGRIQPDNDQHEKIAAEVRRIESLPPAERQKWWEMQFANCIRCYACRQVCPFCYCERCIVDENQPQWIGRSPSVQNNESWNIIRAFHLTGRCVECGECDRACPVGIPLSLLNAKMAAEVKEAYGSVAGTGVDEKPALHTFSADDPEEFIR